MGLVLRPTCAAAEGGAQAVHAGGLQPHSLTQLTAARAALLGTTQAPHPESLPHNSCFRPARPPQRALMPLHKPKCLPAYHQQLSYCVTQVGLGVARLLGSALQSRVEHVWAGFAVPAAWPCCVPPALFQFKPSAVCGEGPAAGKWCDAPLSFILYHFSICFHLLCLPQFVEKDPRLADGVIRALLKFWPLTNSHKEVLFLGELEEVLELTQVCLCARG